MSSPPIATEIIQRQGRKNDVTNALRLAYEALREAEAVTDVYIDLERMTAGELIFLADLASTLRHSAVLVHGYKFMLASAQYPDF